MSWILDRKAIQARAEALGLHLEVVVSKGYNRRCDGRLGSYRIGNGPNCLLAHRIVVVAAQDRDEANRTLHHELQHAVQMELRAVRYRAGEAEAIREERREAKRLGYWNDPDEVDARKAEANGATIELVRSR